MSHPKPISLLLIDNDPTYQHSLIGIKLVELLHSYIYRTEIFMVLKSTTRPQLLTICSLFTKHVNQGSEHFFSCDYPSKYHA